MTRTVGLLLVAGRSRRFGPADKLLALLDGRPLVTHAADAMRGAGCVSPTAVLSCNTVATLLPGFLPLRVAPGLAMSQSFAAVLAHSRGCGATRLLLCLGDMPDIDAALLRQLLEQPSSAACRHQGRHLPPACIVAAEFEKAAGLTAGDHGARALIASFADGQLITVDDAQARGIDRAEDLRDAPRCSVQDHRRNMTRPPR